VSVGQLLAAPPSHATPPVGRRLRDALNHLERNGPTVTTPLLIVHGTGDKITSAPASRRLWEAAATVDKTYLQYDGAWHVLWTGGLWKAFPQSPSPSSRPVARNHATLSWCAEPVDTRQRMMDDLLSWLIDRVQPERRAALSYPIAVSDVRPLGVGPFEAPSPDHPLSFFTVPTHGHLLQVDHPSASPIVHAPPADARDKLRAAGAAYLPRTPTVAAAAGSGTASGTA